MNDRHHHFMGIALDEARSAAAAGDRAFGAAIVREGVVVAVGRNTANTSGVPVHHAETVAILNACRDGRRDQLVGATLYATQEPCPLCLWAMLECGIARLVLGSRHADRPDRGRADVGDYSVERLLALTQRSLDLVTGVRTEECACLAPRWPEDLSWR